MTKLDSKKLSMLSTGCKVSCCKHGSPYVPQEERDMIVKESGSDFFVKKGDDYFIIGKNPDGSPRDMENQQCPFLNEEDRCSLQIKDPKLKPRDCYIHPLFPIKDEEGKLQLWVNDCCEIYKFLPKYFVDEVKTICKGFSSKRLKMMWDHQQQGGFPLIKFEE